jgi:lipopolysaccharide/colanic/teichoic acid biosynthesis glycosyltransferase
MSATSTTPNSKHFCQFSFEEADNHSSTGEYLERFLALFMLLILSPIIVVCMILVKITSQGPAIYRQLRVGKHGKTFTLLKLRTMYNDCEKYTGPIWCRPGDPRVTTLGRFLRWSHLDELLQLVNVIRGEMSLVGPRPERPELIPMLAQAFPRYLERLAVKPGITGLAQIQLPPDTDLVSVEKKLACDLYYVHHRNLWLDLRIILATFFRFLGLPVKWTLKLLALPEWHKVYKKLEQRCAHSPDSIILNRIRERSK